MKETTITLSDAEVKKIRDILRAMTDRIVGWDEKIDEIKYILFGEEK